jgi:DNA-binding NtrC family response regulator
MDEAFRVLVVDDEKDFVETLVKRLKGRGIEAFGITSGEEALELMKQGPFDVVILDIRMPGMDGISALREMKRVQPRTEVILLTGHATVESSIQGLELGAFDFLVKPVQMEDLVVKMAQALERKDAHEQRRRSAKVREWMRHPTRD